jgi:hypothetical protein
MGVEFFNAVREKITRRVYFSRGMYLISLFQIVENLVPRDNQLVGAAVLVNNLKSFQRKPAL